MSSVLFAPYPLSSCLTLKNRIVMAPMTRRRALPDHSQASVMADYYAKRAEAGLIVTEGTLISQDAIGYGNIPGIFTAAHIKSWQQVTEAVHAKGGMIFLQLWHCGRVSHPKFHQGRLPIAPSIIPFDLPLGGTGLRANTCREATQTEIIHLITDYQSAAANALAAHFDGVELHGANGYLIDQFLHYCSNQRSGSYGGTPTNMARFCLEVVKACGEAIGFERVGLRLSPGGYLNEIASDLRDEAIFAHLLQTLNQWNIAYVHTGAFDDSLTFPALGNKTMTAFMRQYYHGTLIAAGGYNFDTAAQGIQRKDFDFVAIGRPFIANPDLITRLQKREALQSYHPEMLQDIL